jgi:hypothetical protein
MAMIHATVLRKIAPELTQDGYTNALNVAALEIERLTLENAELRRKLRQEIFAWYPIKTWNLGWVWLRRVRRLEQPFYGCWYVG